MSELQVSVEVFDAQRARDALNTQVINRPLSRDKVRRYMGDMMKGMWKRNGCPIVFDSDGRLVDGQHRLTPVAENDLLMEFVVVRGGTSAGLDLGGRTAAQTLTMMGYKCAARMVAIYNMVTAWMNADDAHKTLGSATARISPVGTVEAIVQDDAVFVEITSALSKYSSDGADIGLAPAVAGALLYMVASDDKKVCYEFLNDVFRGPRDTDAPASVVQRRLREHARSSRTRGSRSLPRDTQLALLIKAWNAHKAGHTIHVLKWDIREDHPVVR